MDLDDIVALADMIPRMPMLRRETIRIQRNAMPTAKIFPPQ